MRLPRFNMGTLYSQLKKSEDAGRASRKLRMMSLALKSRRKRIERKAPTGSVMLIRYTVNGDYREEEQEDFVDDIQNVIAESWDLLWSDWDPEDGGWSPDRAEFAHYCSDAGNYNSITEDNCEKLWDFLSNLDPEQEFEFNQVYPGITDIAGTIYGQDAEDLWMVTLTIPLDIPGLALIIPAKVRKVISRWFWLRLRSFEHNTKNIEDAAADSSVVIMQQANFGRFEPVTLIVR